MLGVAARYLISLCIIFPALPSKYFCTPGKKGTLSWETLFSSTNGDALPRCSYPCSPDALDWMGRSLLQMKRRKCGEVVVQTPCLVYWDSRVFAVHAAYAGQMPSNYLGLSPPQTMGTTASHSTLNID